MIPSSRTVSFYSAAAEPLEKHALFPLLPPRCKPALLATAADAADPPPAPFHSLPQQERCKATASADDPARRVFRGAGETRPFSDWLMQWAGANGVWGMLRSLLVVGSRLPSRSRALLACLCGGS